VIGNASGHDAFLEQQAVLDEEGRLTVQKLMPPRINDE
jgi:hypothetical protein